MQFGQVQPFRILQIRTHLQYVIVVEAGIDDEEISQRAQEQRRAHQQRQ